MIAVDWRPSLRKLRQFSALLFAVLVVLMLLREPSPVLVIAGAAALFGIVWPAIIRPVYLALTLVTLPIGWVVSHVLLRVVYYLVLTPLGLLLRLTGRDPLRLRKTERESHWEAFQQGQDVESYFRQT